ncbi:LysR family transcriptional regulator [Burkholderia ubonensis]|uniref:LysR family transcriptional regulator n=1 Tax=Burkholderia ubonensis TaxID=101571 RepID=A0AB74DDK8_9BURK|nr:LysR family transcriptional regulator [Burkholderia ubonensis]PAJ82470.1 LysR family transcriptional regulator [Burkholderia ubonensis]PAJ87368.1 LysR family transcriptional regulator [Burkholderia ubonensis]PAJ98350.1 LysR family transcriptional regulator [Burkholderia ubonensis]PAK09966.1 LysR family transcriptional regulator [Burkholderia ubonensis]PAK16549.1 LysR family transcriptional regulator [Burkholderia ubonensis]
MRQVELRHLRYFVAVAEAGSVMAGARAVGIVQPALSRQIRELEDAIGTPLLVRRATGVSLTEAGASFLRDATRLLADLRDSRERALRSAAGELGELRLGVLPNYFPLPVVSNVLKAFRDACPHVKLSIAPMLSAEQAAAIARGELDGGIMAWRRDEAPQLAGVRLLSDRFVLAMPSTPGRRVRAPARLAELADAPFVWFDPQRSAAHHRFLIEQCRREGFTPRIAQVGSDVPTLIGLVAAGMGCAFVPESAAPSCPGTVRLVALDTLAECFDVEFVYDGHAVSPVVRQFLAALHATAGA